MSFFRSEIWYALGKLRERFTNVDETRLIAVDMVTKITQHFEKIREAQTLPKFVFNFFFNSPKFLDYFSGNPQGQFTLAHHLSNTEKELGYLRKVSELLLVSLFPRSTFSPSVNRSLLIEILTCKGNINPLIKTDLNF